MRSVIVLYFLLSSLATFAQLPFEPDYIMDYKYAVKTGTMYNEVSVENGKPKYGRTADSPISLAKLLNVPEMSVIEVKSLQKTSEAKMFEDLQHIQLDYPRVERASQYQIVNFLPNSLMVIRYISAMHPEHANLVFCTLEAQTISGHTFLNVYKDGSIAGRIYPMKDGYKLRMFHGYGNTQPAAGPVTDAEALHKKVRQNFPRTEIFTEKEKYGLRLQQGKKVIVPAVHDSISFVTASMVAVHSGKKITLLYRNGEAGPENIRAIQPQSDSFAGVLVGNEAFLLFTDGTLLDKMPDYRGEGCGTIPHYTDSIVKQDGYYKHRHYYQYGETRLTETVIGKLSEFKDVKLLSGKAVSYGLTTAYYSPYNTNPKGYIVTLNSGAKSIIELKNDGTYKLSLEPDDYAFTAKEYEMGVPLRFKSNGLHGFWPQNDSSQYKELADFDKGFARYTLPDGSKGWLSLDGGEYGDE
ncbi:hypothetical protein [uncultured Flavobacterium sp.]|uniref:hypothetical protein n=1 Tax=uncultured Flavobacterium sp. TaxID=165435 RepID=UPI0025CF8861|nr:hypothetical protein [uncultured Flavobacterium sp.]